MNEFFTNLIVAVICGLIAWLVKTTVPYIKAKLQSSQYAWAAEIIEYTVRAYEQMTEGSGQGDEKFRLVLEQTKAELSKYGITLTNTQIATLIESAVQTMNAERLIMPADEPTEGEHLDE
jgi:hypothetical protein